MSTGMPDGEFGERETQWDAYSDYQLVSQRVTRSISDALDAYVLIDAGMKTGYKLRAQEEAELRADILGAAMRLRIELENERESREVYDEILSDWEGDEGYISRFRKMNLEGQPGAWLEEFITQIRRAGWELGYLKAGREEESKAGGGAYDGEVVDMIEGMTI